ncbi:MAG TPA: general secretion pathway protein GspB [Povalibacter sp.]|uniref:general secretion pathway protein GspB n=1 Tax=Povalibacter sp. TaxID=1962978 RepID=UPI002BA612DB|nr:general secretion pathway protein GspB [Povalibacter sp.]HMN45181.1 general secretion pathway protein GspB [Povalibacter sp.]
MSFILDALKKSENERQRTIGPSLADAPARAPQSERPWWAVAVAGLLVGNLAILLFVLLRDDKAPAAAAPVAAAVTTAPAASPVPYTRTPPASRPSIDPSVRSLAEEAGASAESYEGSDFVDDSGFDEHPPAAAAARPIEPPAVAPLAARPAAEPRAEVLPNASSLIASGTSLPDMRLDIHVYSNTPSERFVFINMRKYTEGQTLTEGPTVERITPEGAVLNQQGLRFVLPRQ